MGIGQWYTKYPELQQIQVITLGDRRDELVWKSRNGKVDKFSVRQAYIDLQPEEEHVIWSKMLWVSQNIPKHAFILWLVVQNRLITQVKLKKWGSYDMMVCALCNEDSDSHQHLFFACNYAKQFWNRVCLKTGLHWDEWDWNDTIRRQAGMEHGNNITSIIRRISIAASVYLIWRERNCRLFKEEKRSV